LVVVLLDQFWFAVGIFQLAVGHTPGLSHVVVL
jgi:hypothetical protein